MLGAERLDPRSANVSMCSSRSGTLTGVSGQVFEAWQAKENVRDLYTLSGEPAVAALWIDAIINDAKTVNGHEFFPAGGQRDSPRTVVKFPRGWPWFSLAGWVVSGRGA